MCLTPERVALLERDICDYEVRQHDSLSLTDIFPQNTVTIFT